MTRHGLPPRESETAGERPDEPIEKLPSGIKLPDADPFVPAVRLHVVHIVTHGGHICRILILD